LSKKSNNIQTKYFYYLLIIFNSFLITYYSGLRGVFPLDSFLIFDSGYKILNNFLPFRDYWSITGPFVDYVQYLIFYFFSINWLSYVLHSALINALISLVLYYFLTELNIEKKYALFYSLSIGILAYPSVGTPFVDHHGTIFSLLSLIFLILGIKKNKKFCWFLVPILLGFSFLSKQIPSVYFGQLFLIIITINLYLSRYKNVLSILWILFGSISLFCTLFVIIYFNEIPLYNILIQYILYPLSIGKSRLEYLDFNFQNTIFQFKFIYFSIIPLLISGYFLINKKIKDINVKKDILILFSILSSVLIFIYSQLLTKNQILIFFIIPFYLGLAHYYLNNYFKKKSLIYLLFLILFISTLKFHQRFNVEKKFMELSKIDLKLAIDANYLDESLKGLSWITPLYPQSPKKELDLLKNAVKNIIEEKEKKIIISDYQILPFLTDTKNFAPNKWFDQQSVPSKKNMYYNDYREFFINKLREQKINFVFIVGAKKIKYINEIFINKDCFEKKILNQITQKINIKNC